MGSFNVGCGLSSLSIGEGDAVGFMLLTAKETFPRPYPQAAKTLTGHIYSTDLYEPYLPPVYGVYDDYGNIAELQESATTQAIEDIFHRPALDVINAVGQDRGLYSTYGTIVRLYMDDAIVKVIDDYHATDDEKFAALGFTPARKTKAHAKRFRYENYELRGAIAETSGLPPEYERFEWELLNITTGKIAFSKLLALNGLEELFSTFAVATGYYPGFAADDWASIGELQRMNGMFFLKDIYAAVVDPIVNNGWNKDATARWTEKFETAMRELVGGSRLYSPHFMELERTVGMRGLAWHSLQPLVGTGEYAEINRFLDVMTATNRMLMPSFNGEQHGDTHASIVLAEASLTVLAKRRDDEDEFRGDEDEG